MKVAHVRVASRGEDDTRPRGVRMHPSLTEDILGAGCWGKCRGHVSWLEKPVSYIWCDAPGERTIEPYLDPAEAIRAGLRRAARVACWEAVAVALEDRPRRADRMAAGQRGRSDG